MSEICKQGNKNGKEWGTKRRRGESNGAECVEREREEEVVREGGSHCAGVGVKE